MPGVGNDHPNPNPFWRWLLSGSCSRGSPMSAWGNTFKSTPQNLHQLRRVHHLPAPAWWLRTCEAIFGLCLPWKPSKNVSHRVQGQLGRVPGTFWFMVPFERTHLWMTATFEPLSSGLAIYKQVTHVDKFRVTLGRFQREGSLTIGVCQNWTKTSIIGTGCSEELSKMSHFLGFIACFPAWNQFHSML